MNLEELLAFIRDKWGELQKSKLHSFKEFVDENCKPKKGVLNFAGCYVVYDGDRPIYVGSAGKGKHVLRYRIGDLFSDYSGKEGERRYYHTLTSKLLKGKHKRFSSLYDVRNFYMENCKIQVLRTNNICEARLMEAILINMLQPTYNSETENRSTH